MADPIGDDMPGAFSAHVDFAADTGGAAKSASPDLSRTRLFGDGGRAGTPSGERKGSKGNSGTICTWNAMTRADKRILPPLRDRTAKLVLTHSSLTPANPWTSRAIHFKSY